MGYQDAVAETTPAIVTSAEPYRAPRSTQGILSRLLGYLVQPQWIAIGTAALVLLLAVPVFIILKSSKPNGRAPNSMSARDPEAAATAGKPDPSDAGRGFVDRDTVASNGDISNERISASSDGSSSAAQPATPAIREAKVEAAPPAPAASPSDAASQKTAADYRASEPPNASGATQVAQINPSNRQQDSEQQSNQANSKPAVSATVSQVEEKPREGPSPPSQVSAGQYDATGKKVDQTASTEQISSKQAQTLPEDDKNSGVNILRGVGSDSARAKDSRQTIRPKDSEPPKSESTRDEAERRIAKGPARGFSGAAGAGTDADSVHKSPTQPITRSQKLERRVDTKRFRMQAGIWTDRDFKPAKEIPAVTLIRDSEVYKSALEKQPGLKVFLASFASDERVIVVYKGVVYKVVPSKD
jgi:hypothetical protein